MGDVEEEKRKVGGGRAFVSRISPCSHLPASANDKNGTVPWRQALIDLPKIET